MGFPKFGSSKHNSSSSSLQALDYTNHDDHPIELSINIESPPCVLYGSATESSGALLGGLLTVTINDDLLEIQPCKSTPLTPVNSGQRKQLTNSLTTSLSHLSLSHTHHAHYQKSGDNLKRLASMSNLITPPKAVTSVSLNSVELSLIQKVHYEKPFRPSAAVLNTCTNCKTKITEFHRWTIMNKPTELTVGQHSFPFSHLIPGSLPATTHLGSNSHSTIKYELIAVVTYKHPFKGKGESAKRVLQLNLPIPITRSILRGSDKTSLRVFPPTELTANAVLPNVVYPKSTFSMELKLDGICSDDRRWRMRKLNWRIEEKVKVRAHGCQAHKAKLKQLEEKVMQDEERDRQIRKSSKPIKRSVDMGPQVKMTVNTFHDVLLQQLSRANTEAEDADNPEDTTTAPSDEAARDEDHDTIPDTPTDFIHPNDDAMRQEIMQQQQRVRQQQIEEELKQESALYTEEVRTIANGEIKSGWKSDFSNKGTIELVTDIDCMRLNSGVTNPISHASTRNPCVLPNQDNVNVSCDIEDTNLGVYVSHLLFVEVIVAEEQLQNVNGGNRSRTGSTVSDTSKAASKPKNNADQRLAELSPIFADRENKPQPVIENQPGNNVGPKIVGVPTGAARVLRMQFRVIMTERSGLGISWDDEVPPAYQDIRMLTPPRYQDVSTTLLHSTLSSPTITPPGESSLFTLETGNGAERPVTGSAPETRSNSSVRLNSNNAEYIRPPPALHHSANTSSTSIAFQFSDLDHVMSIQGAEPGFNSALTPQTTRMINVPTISELLDTDRITQ
ncbi:Ldb19 [Kluyveromyces lactis]|nr:Ldb19 [Kluyveromyces lactis]